MGSVARARVRKLRSGLSPIERTRFLLGIVMIPLAATCVFAAGVYSQRHVMERADARAIEVKAVWCDRERRGDEAAEHGAASEEPQPGSQVHGGGGAAGVRPAGLAAVAVPVSASFGREVFLPAGLPAGAFLSPPALRGPPMAAC